MMERELNSSDYADDTTPLKGIFQQRKKRNLVFLLLLGAVACLQVAIALSLGFQTASKTFLPVILVGGGIAGYILHLGSKTQRQAALELAKTDNIEDIGLLIECLQMSDKDVHKQVRQAVLR